MTNGIELRTTFNDDSAESKSFTGTVSAHECQPEPCTVQVRIGYDVCGPLYLHECKTMEEMKTQFDADSTLATVSSLAEFRAAVIDAAIVAEEIRIRRGNAVVDKHQLPDNPRPRRVWDWIRSVERGQRPRLHIFLSTPTGANRRDDRCYILADHAWHWDGWSDVQKIDYPKLYAQLLRTEQHRKNLGYLCGAIGSAI